MLNFTFKEAYNGVCKFLDVQELYKFKFTEASPTLYLKIFSSTNTFDIIYIHENVAYDMNFCISMCQILRALRYMVHHCN